MLLIIKDFGTTIKAAMDPQSNSHNIPTVFIIFGATGDLMGKKIVPSLYHLYKKGKFPKLFKIIGFSRRDLSEEQFIHYVRELLEKHGQNKYPKEDLDKFLSYFLYQKGNFDEGSSYKTLASRMGIIDGGWNVCSNKLFYLAVPPQYYKNISEHLSSSGLTIPCGPDEGWTRVIVEKPFGKDQKSAEELDILLSKLFKEEQIYRIDHYLAKEMLQNILAFRFANSLFEDIWNNKHIESIDIRTRESIGAEGRGSFYDGLGALRDVGQNHLLQMLALVTMENPGVLDSEHVRKKRAELLATLGVLTGEEIINGTYRAQHNGYREVQGVSTKSDTETYFKVVANLESSRWKGVRITLEAGKKLPLKKEIVITFKHPTPCACPTPEHFQNKVIFSLEPKEGITIEFWSKKPGLEYTFVKRNLNFINRRVNERVQYVEEYEKLLLDCISGNQILFLSTPEITACWSYIDPIIEAWKKDLVPLHFYKPGSKEAINKALKMSGVKTEKKLKKEIGMVGLGKMGGNAALQLVEKGWNVVGYNRTYSVTENFAKQGVIPASTLSDLVSKLSKPRIIWLMLTAGGTNDEVIFGDNGLATLLEKGDIIIDAGNSFYKEAKVRFEKLKKLGIHFVDVGFSGGPGGARKGACLMVGGEKALFEKLYPLYQDLAVSEGVAHFPGIGAGHFVKMIHNGIEYGMMQAIAEGFATLKKSPFGIDIAKTVHVYNHGSVVESSLTKWLENGIKEYGEELKDLSGSVGHTGEGEWTVKTANELGVEAKVIKDSFQFRVESMQHPSFEGKVLTAMRNQFGGHSIEKGKMT